MGCHAQRRFHHDDSRPRSGDDFGDGAEQRRQDSRLESKGGRELGRVSSFEHGGTAAAHARHGLRQLPDSRLPGRDRRGFHQHLSHRSLSRRRAAGVGIEYRAATRQSGRRAGHGPVGNSSQEFYSARSIPVHHRHRRRVRLRRL